MRNVRKELKSQNKRLQEKRIDNQEKMISVLESALSNNEKIDKEKACSNQPLKTEIKRAKFEKTQNESKWSHLCMARRIPILLFQSKVCIHKIITMQPSVIS